MGLCVEGVEGTYVCCRDERVECTRWHRFAVNSVQGGLEDVGPPIANVETEDGGPPPPRGYDAVGGKVALLNGRVVVPGSVVVFGVFDVYGDVRIGCDGQHGREGGRLIQAGADLVRVQVHARVERRRR